MDTVTMLRVLFGGGYFDDAFGEITLITMLQLVWGGKERKGEERRGVMGDGRREKGEEKGKWKK
jgi:hypothetical protein